MDHERLSRTVAHALRHEPGAYGLELDEGGWASLDRLLEALRGRHGRWHDLERGDLERMMERSERRRYEIREGRIRALYGHSVDVRLAEDPSEPPERLFHGTSPAAAERILEEGLRPMGRQHVHLSADVPAARDVGRRKAPEPRILAVDAGRAHRAGVSFYRGSEEVWLAGRVPPEYLEEVP